jgi:hypothetical protein
MNFAAKSSIPDLARALIEAVVGPPMLGSCFIHTTSHSYLGSSKDGRMGSGCCKFQGGEADKLHDPAEGGL